MKEKNIKNFKYYGIKKQMPVWCEEMSELTKEICKWARKGEYDKILLDNLKEKIVDVIVCLDQIIYAIGLEQEEIKERYKYKVERQKNRIDDENARN